MDSNLSSARQCSDRLLAALLAEQSELAHQILKDPYTFDFLSLRPEMLECDLERGLIEQVSSPLYCSTAPSIRIIYKT
ncbi:hypothetical protein C5748_13170 [Phyllobacterium phragmitis]|uniref:Uncharacterized protein n=1 Tax=Phyllobacterium phragmitis TaxID=2670329 RepID=A0A2S9IRL1_9HYPH|nr:hypothetical protein C5748_13170 [Phyllobacterium phragmitis]